MSTKTKGSQTLLFAFLLTLSGGYLDAYTYHNRDGVFANAQTGNIVKLGISLAQNEYMTALRFLIPIIAFACGIMMAMYIQDYFSKKEKRIHKRVILIIECILCFIVAFIPQTHYFNIFVNVLISFICALRYETFRSLHGLPIATTMSTGNLRSCVEYFYKERFHHQDTKLFREYLLIVLAFIIGAFSNTYISKYLGEKSILISIIPIMIAYIYMTVISKRNNA